jgi:hypothetical protein
MKPTFHKIRHASELPPAWDELAGNYFQRREFLVHTELFNPCRQRYYLMNDGERLLAGAVVYTLGMDLFTFSGMKSPVSMHVGGIPCSVSCPGIIGASNAIQALQEEVFAHEKGLCVFLNLEEQPVSGKWIVGPTLPTIVLENRFFSWSDYIQALRSDYRRRLSRILAEECGIQVSQTDCGAFTPEMHRQYLQVFQRSKGKLEQLGLDFFQKLPPLFRLNAWRLDDRLLGWTITLTDSGVHYFFLGGIDYTLNDRYHSYFRMLAGIVREGVEKGANSIDLGQTAEIPKTRLGGKCIPRYLEGGHSRRWVNSLLHLAKPLLVYQRQIPETHVFQKYENTLSPA